MTAALRRPRDTVAALTGGEAACDIAAFHAGGGQIIPRSSRRFQIGLSRAVASSRSPDASRHRLGQETRMTLSIRLLGGFALDLDGRPVVPGTRKAAALLAVGAVAVRTRAGTGSRLRARRGRPVADL